MDSSVRRKLVLDLELRKGCLTVICLVILEGFKSRRGWVRNSVLQDGVTVGERVPHLFFKHMNLILDHNGGVY